MATYTTRVTWTVLSRSWSNHGKQIFPVSSDVTEETLTWTYLVCLLRRWLWCPLSAGRQIISRTRRADLYPPVPNLRGPPTTLLRPAWSSFPPAREQGCGSWREGPWASSDWQVVEAGFPFRVLQHRAAPAILDDLPARTCWQSANTLLTCDRLLSNPRG